MLTNPDRAESASYRPREFAALAGVTVRTLHYYDRLGLLEPRRTAGGHRLYSRQDLESLQQIVALKAIGVPLRDIAALRHAAGQELAAVLRAQRASLEEQHGHLARLIAAIGDVEVASGADADASGDLLRRLVDAIEMPKSADEWRSVVRETSRHRCLLSADERAALGEQWASLLAEIQSVLDQAPSAPVVQALARRWVGLIQAANGTSVPLATLLRCGDGTLRQLETQWPQLHASPWGRAMNLMRRAVEG
jgi:DNA-binding transcriptional MerR regulator